MYIHGKLLENCKVCGLSWTLWYSLLCMGGLAILVYGTFSSTKAYSSTRCILIPLHIMSLLAPSLYLQSTESQPARV